MVHRSIRHAAVAACVGVLAAAPAAAQAAPVGETAEAGSASVRAAGKKWCGRVRARGQRYRVRVERGSVSCRNARRVIRYVMRRGRASMGSPGRGPNGWGCAWGFGVYRDTGDIGRSGPHCTKRGAAVAGYLPGFRPA